MAVAPRIVYPVRAEREFGSCTHIAGADGAHLGHFYCFDHWRVARMLAHLMNEKRNLDETMIGDQLPQSPGAMPETNPASGKEGET